MQKQTKHGLIIAAVALIAIGGCSANEGAAESSATADAPARPATAWMGDSSVDFVRPGFPAGARLAVMYGNPADTGYFVLRLSLPDGYAIPPHWHPTTEMITVLDGTFVIGMGERADRAQTRSISTGGVGAAPAKMPHFAWAKGATVVQVHGTGPFQLNLVTPVPQAVAQGPARP